MIYTEPPKTSKVRSLFISIAVLLMLMVGLVQVFWSRAKRNKWGFRKEKESLDLTPYQDSLGKLLENDLSNNRNGRVEVHVGPAESIQCSKFRHDYSNPDEVLSFIAATIAGHGLVNYRKLKDAYRFIEYDVIVFIYPKNGQRIAVANNYLFEKRI